MALEPIDHKALRDRVADALREAIVQGQFAVGERLQEERLAAILGAGRGPVREALMKLEAEGLIIREPYRGAHVAAPSREDLVEIFAIREVLEALATRLATPRMRPQDIQALRRVLAERKASGESGRDNQIRMNEGFHETISKRCGNKRLKAMLASLWTQFPKSMWNLRRHRVDEAVREYERILDALEARDAEAAAAAMARHVARGGESLIEIFDRVQASRTGTSSSVNEISVAPNPASTKDEGEGVPGLSSPANGHR